VFVYIVILECAFIVFVDSVFLECDVIVLF